MSATPVWTINQGKAHSGGALVFLCGHERYTYESATFLLHEGATRLGGYMDKSKFMDYAKFYDSLVLVMKDKILANTSITEEEYELHKKDDWWFDAKEAIELKVADKIVTPDIYKTF
jgi:ATP-dependent Clp protease protease subunit